jgi:autotransporter adhesin
VKSTNQNNYDNDLATGDDSMAAGVGAKALGDRSVALGNNTEAQSLGSITVGSGYEDPDNPGSLKQTLAISGYQYNMAIGAGAQAAGNNSLAIGTLATSSIKNGGSSVDKAVAIGYSAGVSDDKAIAIGSDAKSNSKSASAMGDTAQALAENALAIGTNAQAAGVSSGAIGTQNRVTGANTYVLGSQNSTAATGTAADVSASNSGIFGNENRMEGDSNRIVGNQNVLKMESLSNNSSNSETFENIFVTGNHNTVTGDPDTSTAGDAGSVSDITVTGSKNTIQAKNQKNRNLTDIQIVGNQNTVDATTQNADLSNTQILGSHVTATLGNSVYLGSNSAYVVSGATTKGMDVYNSDGTYQYAGGTPAGIVTVGSAEKERRIQNVAAGLVSAKSTDAVNGSQLYTMTRPLRFAGDNSTIGTTSGSDVNVLHRGSDQAMSILGGIKDSAKLSDNNIGVVADAANNKMTVKLAKDVTGLNSITSKNVNAETVKAGDTTVNNQGVTIAGGPSVTKKGINANGTKITNVAAGTEDTDAVNVSQLTKQSADLTEKGFGLKDQDGNIVHKSLGKDIEVTGDGKNISTKVENGTMKVVLNDDLNVNSVTTADADGNQTVTQGSGMTVTDKDGNETTIGAGGITITPKDLAPGTSSVSLTKNGLDNGGNQIHNVAAGTAGTDAVNVSQLQDEIAKNATKLADGKNTTVTGTGTTENPYKVNVNDNLNLGEKGDNGIDGSIGVAGKDGSAVTINGKDGSIGMNGKDGKDGLTMKSAKGQDGVDGPNGANGMTRIVYEDDGHATHEVATLDDGLKFAGNKGSVAKKLNETMTIKGTGTKADSQYDSSNIKTMVNDNGDMIIGLDKNLKADTVTVGGQGKDGADGINGAIGVKGADGKDGVTISSIGKDGTNGTDGHIGINGKDGASADIHVVKGVNGVDGTDGYNGTDGIDRIVYEDHNENTQTVATMNDGMKYGGDVGNVINKKLNGQVNVVGGITDSSKLSTEDNIGVVSDGSDNLKVRLSKDLKGLDSVTTKTVTADTGNITTVNASTVNVGDTTITTGGMTIQNGSAGQDVTLNKDGLNNGGNKITNVAPGDISSTSTDAVNGSQLYGTETRINRLGNRINHVGAGAAALAGLHPLDFDPDDKWDFAAGYGNYKNANAVAIGAYYRPNEDTMFSVGGSFSGGENMVNVGVSWKFGQKSHISRSRVSMAKDMLAMKNQIETLTKKLAAYESGQPVKLAPIATGAMTFPDVPENHWAYEYVKNLAERGYLKGYPDGEFKGDRAMTRYEYAAIIYRALQNGAPSDGNMTRSVDDFGPELVKVQDIDRFRVDRISGKDNDRHKVERVRVNDKDDKAQNVYRDVYGNHIQK